MLMNVISSHSMRIDVIVTNRSTLSSRPFNFFLTASLSFTVAKLFHQLLREKTNIKLRPLCIHNGSCFETLNLLYVTELQNVYICDVLHERKQKTETNSREFALRTENQL